MLYKSAFLPENYRDLRIPEIMILIRLARQRACVIRAVYALYNKTYISKHTSQNYKI